MLIKKYGNRRLYDTEDSRYITLEELAERVRAGADPRVVDARTGEDLTRATLAQIIVESRGAGMLLPVPLLVQLVRLGDDAFAEFFGRWVTWALEIYVATRQGLRAETSWNPFTGGGSWTGGVNPFFQRVPWGSPAPGPQPPSPPPPAAGPGPGPGADDLAALRREIEELRQSLRKPKK